MKKIVKFRKKYGLTQAEIAHSLGISRVSYNMKENGKRQFKPIEMLKLYKYFEKKGIKLDIQEFF